MSEPKPLSAKEREQYMRVVEERWTWSLDILARYEATVRQLEEEVEPLRCALAHFVALMDYDNHNPDICKLADVYERAIDVLPVAYVVKAREDPGAFSAPPSTPPTGGGATSNEQ